MQAFSRRELAWALVTGATISRAFALTINEPFPHFVAKTLDGERITSESIKGSVVLIDFWATWCPPCKRDQPIVESLLREFEKQGLIVLAVNMGEPRRKVKKYLETSPRASKVILAEDTTLAAICDANAYPIYNVIDREGRLAGVQRGAGGERALRHLLEKAGLEEA
ncbi:MAG: TlpA disulfide reductase family protein [Bryobacteraceae bacterium]